MSTSVPESFSMDELSKAMESAPNEDELRENLDKREYSEEYIRQVAEDALDMASNLVKDPLVHKLMAMFIMSRMVEWHTLIGEKLFLEGQNENAICWIRDAGKFQSMLDSMTAIYIGDNDFTCTVKN